MPSVAVCGSIIQLLYMQLFAELDNHLLYITKTKSSTSVIMTEFNHVIKLNDNVVHILAIQLLHLLYTTTCDIAIIIASAYRRPNC